MSASPGRHHHEPRAARPDDDRPVRRRATGLRGAPVIAGLFLAIVAGAVALATWAQATGRPSTTQRSAAVAANADPKVTAVVDAVSGYLGILDTVDGYQTLNKGLPFGGADFLKDRYGKAFRSIETARAQVQKLGADPKTVFKDLNAKLDDIDGNGNPAVDGSVAGVVLDLDVDLTGDLNSASFQAVVKLTVKSAGVPGLGWLADGLTVNGQPVNANLGFTSSTTITVTPLAATKFAIKVDGTQTGALRVGVNGEFKPKTATEPGNPLAFRVGVLGVAATGKVAADIGVKVVLVDPGTGTAQDGRIDSTELGDLSKLFKVSCLSSGATGSLTVGTDVVGLTTDVGSISLQDATLCDGISAPTVKLADLGNLRNVTVGDVINGVAQVARALQSAQDAGDIDLPFVTEGLSKVVQVNEKLVKFFVDNKLTDPAHPLDTITFDKDKPPFATLQELTPKLAAALGLPAGALEMQEKNGAITFVVHKATDPAATPNAGTIDFGDTLGKVGIGAVSGTAKASIDPEYSLDFGFGFLTAPGKALDERFFLTNTPAKENPDVQRIFSLNAVVQAKLDLQGTIPPVGLTVATPGTVKLLAPGAAPGPMLSVALVDPTPDDGRVTLADVATSVQNKQFPVAATVNAQVPPVALNATLDVLGTGIGSGALSVAWPDIRVGTPTVTADALFKTQALQFAFDTSDPKKLVVQVLNAARSAVTGLRTGIATGALSTRTPLPLAGKSLAELEPVLVELQGSLDDLISRADRFTLPTLEAKINRAVADAFGVAADAAAPDVLTLAYEPSTATANAAIVAKLDLSVCTEGRRSGCTITNKPVALPFNLQLGSASRTGGVAGVGTSGMVSLGYDATAHLSFGVTLPKVSLSDSGVLSVSGGLSPFVQDDTAFSVGLGARLAGTLSAALGPFSVSLGKPAQGGQPAQNAIAQVAARFALGTAHNPAQPKRYGPDKFATFFTSLLPVAGSANVHETTANLPKANCPGLTGPYDACATLPVFLDTTSLGSITFTAPDLLTPAGWKIDSSQVEAKLADESVRFALLLDGVKALSAQLEKSLRSLPAGTKIPLIGTDVLAGADAVKAFNDSVLQPVTDLSAALKGLDRVGLVKSTAVEYLEKIPGRTGSVVVTATCRPATGTTPVTCGDTASITSLQSLEVSLPLHLGTSAGVPFDLGFPGLSLKSEGNLVGNAGIDVALSFGVDRDLGFYLPTKASTKEFSINANVELPQQMKAQLGFVPISVTDQHDGADVTVGFDLDLATKRADGRLTLQELGAATLTPTLKAEADANLQLQTQLDSRATSGMPRISAVFDLDAGVTWTPGSAPVPHTDLGFRDVEVDLGSVMTQYIKPAIAEIRKYTSPLEPAIDAIQQPVPGVKEASELAGLKPLSWLELFEQIDKIVTPTGGVSGLQMVQRLIGFVNTVKALDTQSAETGTVSLGDFDILSSKAQTPTPVADAGTLVTNADNPSSLLSAFGKDVGPTLTNAAAKGGLKFPVLEKPSLLFGMLLGQDVDLVTFDAGKLQIQRGLQFGFPIGPLNLYIGGSATLSGHFAAGFDTYGIRKAFEYATDDDRSNDGFFKLAEGVLLGLYLDDFDADDNDVPEITFRAELTAGASIGVPLFSVGAEGGIGGQIDFDLHTEPAQKGKIRYSDIAAQLKKNGNPLCFFDASAKVDAFIRAYLETPLGKSVYPIASGVVWQQDDLFAFCQQPVEEQEKNLLGDVVDGEFQLKADDTSQDVVIRQEDDDTILVEAGGRQEQYDDVTRIHADLGDGADQLDLVRHDGYQGTGLPVRACGGGGVDRIASDLGPSVLSGDGGEGCATVTVASSGGDTLTGGGAKDLLDGGAGDDVLVGNGELDRLDGGAGNDVLRGGTGSDTVVGGGDNDTVDYSDHTTAVTVRLPGLSGSPDQDEQDKVTETENVVGSPANDLVLVTAPGSYRIDGGFGNDTVRPGPAAAIVFGGEGDDTVVGGTATTQFLGGGGNDGLVDGPGFETFLGGDGTDTANYTASTVSLSLTVDGRADDGPSRNGLPAGSDNLVDVDVVLGGNLADHLTGGPAGETLKGNGGKDLLEGGPGDDVLVGDGDDDRLVGDDGADRLDGGAGKDTLDGGTGPDTFVGGPEFDTADYSYRTDDLEISKNGLADDGNSRTREGDNVTNTVEKIVGGQGSDTISGNGANEEFVGGPGGDTISGFGGADVFDGGPGDDKLYDWEHNQKFSEVLDGTAVDTMSGGPGNDELYANGGADVVNGGTEADIIYGGTGDDVIDAGPGEDSVHAGPEKVTAPATDNDTVKGGDDHDGIFGGDGNDTIDAGAGSCTVYAGLGSDTVTTATPVGRLACSVYLGNAAGTGEQDTSPNTFTGTGPGRDDVRGGNGADTINVGDGGGDVDGGAGDDTITMGVVPANDQIGNKISGGPGNDTLRGGPGTDTLKGDVGNDHLFGNGGDDVLYGNGYNPGPGTDDDDLHGGPGHDDLDGSEGNDLLDGGDGADVFDGGAGSDTVTYADRVDGVTVTVDGFDNEGNALDVSADGQHRDSIANDVEGVTGGKGADRITFGVDAGRTTTLYLSGGPGADVLTVTPATTLPTVLDGGPGNDTITGGRGADRMLGGAGTDRFVALGKVDGADVVSGGTEVDTVDYRLRPKGSVRVTLDDKADDGATGEKDNVRSDVETVVLGQTVAAAPVTPGATTAPGAGETSTGTAAGTPAPAVPAEPTTPGAPAGTPPAGTTPPVVPGTTPVVPGTTPTTPTAATPTE